MPLGRVEVHGVREFQRELRAAGREWPKELRVASRDAAEVVATGARRSFESRPGVAPKVADSVKVLAQQRSAAVRIGGRRWPYAMGSEFGSKRYRQFPPPRRGGYSLYATIAATRDEVVEQYAEAVDRLMRRAFPG